MAYRDDTGEVCEAPTAEGTLRAEIAPRHVKLAVANRSLVVVDRVATATEHHRKHPAKDRRLSFRIAGRLLIARDVPRDGLGVWIELEPGGPGAGFRRIFGVDPVNLLEPAGLAGLAALDRLAGQLRLELGPFAEDVRRAVELGSSATGGLDKVLLVDHADRCEVYVRRLFRDRARLVITAHRDGRIAVREGRGGRRTAGTLREIVVRSRHGVIASGDALRFTDPQGTDLTKVSIPWITPEDRVELARRIGQQIDHDLREVTAWPPRLQAGPDPA